MPSLAILCIYYFAVASCYATLLLAVCLTEPETSKRDHIDWMVIAIASIFWIIVIPISALELITQRAMRDRS